MKEEETTRLSLTKARELLKGTDIENISDEELDKLLDGLKSYCQICLSVYKSQFETKSSDNNT